MKWIQRNFEPIIGFLLLSALVGLIAFCAIPVNDSMIVDKIRWTWDIPIEVYTSKSFDSLSSPPSDAYEVRTESETYYTTKTYTVRGADGNTYTDTVRIPQTRVRYYYKRNVWVFEYNITSMGFDHKPYEKECSFPNDISNPVLGDKRRRPHKETYEVISTNTKVYKVSKSEWDYIDQGGRIYYKRFRYGNRIWNIKFGTNDAYSTYSR